MKRRSLFLLMNRPKRMSTREQRKRHIHARRSTFEQKYGPPPPDLQSLAKEVVAYNHDDEITTACAGCSASTHLFRLHSLHSFTFSPICTTERKFDNGYERMFSRRFWHDSYAIIKVRTLRLRSPQQIIDPSIVGYQEALSEWSKTATREFQ